MLYVVSVGERARVAPTGQSETSSETQIEDSPAKTSLVRSVQGCDMAAPSMSIWAPLQAAWHKGQAGGGLTFDCGKDFRTTCACFLDGPLSFTCQNAAPA